MSKGFPLEGNDQAPEETILFHRFDLPGGITLIGVGAEVFAEYKKVLDILSADVGRQCWPVSCANGMYGYLTDRDVIESASGYEYESWRHFGHPGPLPRQFPDWFTDQLQNTADISSGRGPA